ncbi:hypothetical protein LPJ79_001556 [Coemansia sp. RSA 1821]|nr:hypothetical protein LPJ79_001556 [Coemansia sp. RSA 1821]
MSSPTDSSAKLPLHKRVFRRTARLLSDAPKENNARKSAANLSARKIYINLDVPEDELPAHAQNYCTNAITTSQYTLLNFLPKNLSRQFRRVANIYFLVLTILQLISYFSVGSRFLTVVPIILVLAITAIKDAFEDWRRHISDKHFNETPTRLVRNLRNTNISWQDQQSAAAKHSFWLRTRIRLARQLKRKTWYNQVPHDWEEAETPVDPSMPPVLEEKAKWRSVRVGDFVILRDRDPAPSDVLILATSADDGGCYVETKDLDGETNLKPRASIPETSGVRDPEGCGRLCAVVEVDPPTSKMTQMNGSIRLLSAPAIPEADDAPGYSAPPTARALQSPVSPAPAPAPASVVSPRQHASPLSPSNDNYEMKLLGPRQAAPFRQSPLAQPAAAPSPTSHFRADDEAKDAPPSYDMDTAVPSSSSDGAVLGKSLPGDIDYSTSPQVVPFSISNVLLRGMVVRNTDWVVGLVMYTGEQTKTVLNSGETPFKRSRIERMMNTQVLLSFGFVFATSFVVALVGGLRYAEPEQRWAMYVDTSMPKGTYGFALFWSAMIMLQNVIPIALYVSIEFVKTWHAYWIYEDINMYYRPTEQRCKVNNWSISDDLGQVSYVFSDKTGTLTRNVMDFRMCSINGVIYGKQLPGDELDVVKGRRAQEEVDRNNPPEGGANPFFMEIQDDASFAPGSGSARQQPGPLDSSRPSASSSIASHGTSQYDSSPLISTAEPPAAPAGAKRTRTRTRAAQAASDEEQQARRRQMLQAYLGAMRSVLDPVYVEIGNEETGEGGAYTFVDPQLFYDMKPEAAPAGHGVPGPGQGLAPPEPIRRIGSHRSIGNGFDVDPIRQRDAIDLFLTEVATCHSVVVENAAHSQIPRDDADDRSTLRRLTKIFHSRSGSRRITEKVRHMRTRSRLHGRTESAATASSFGDGVEWEPSSDGSGHARNESLGFAHARTESAASDRFVASPLRSAHARLDSGGLAYQSEPGSASQLPALGSDAADAPYAEPAQLPGAMPSARDLQSGLAQAVSAAQSKGPRPGPGPGPAQDPSRLSYSAESPDEGALVRAAKNFGYTFLGRVKSTIYLDVRGEKVQYEVLDTIEFNSTRKRMSTILRRPAPHSDIILFCKGADNVMIERLAKLPAAGDDAAGHVFGSREELRFERVMRERTFSQIDEFANAGLRTLMLGYRRLSESEWVRWSARYHAAQASVESDREDRIAEIAAEMERDLRIAGATAIEDKLQERVPDTIAALRAAGMRIWVLTGDKMETAINIGFAANLLTKEMELWTISSASGADEVLSRFRLVARIMRETAAGGGGFESGVGLGGADAQTLGSVSYKIGRARKFLDIKHTLRQRRHRRQRAQLDAAAHEQPMSPEEVQQSINYLRRHSSLTADGMPEAGAGDPGAASRPLNALVIDGAALSMVMNDEECRAQLLAIAPLFKSVVCCRASPLQKAEVVRLVKDGLGLVTLAIGDGANDVSMIQTADIGVAISGEEGLQAAMASDYTMGRFHFLQNLLLVHGLFDYLRMSEMILSFFYKNVIWAMVPFWYSIYCSFSANVFYDLSYIQLYNVVFTVAPVVILGCVDKPFNYETAMTYVAVYSDGIRNRYFQWWRYVLYVVDGIYQSVVIFFTFYLFTYVSDVQNSNGHTWGRSDLSTGPTVAVVVAASLCVGFNAWQWNWIMAVSIGLSIVVCLAYISISSAVRYYSLEGIATTVMSTVQFWFGVVIAVVVAMLPRYSVHTWQKINRPRDLDIIREIKVLHRPWYGQVFVEPEAQATLPPHPA